MRYFLIQIAVRGGVELLEIHGDGLRSETGAPPSRATGAFLSGRTHAASALDHRGKVGYEIGLLVLQAELASDIVAMEFDGRRGHAQ